MLNKYAEILPSLARAIYITLAGATYYHDNQTPVISVSYAHA